MSRPPTQGGSVGRAPWDPQGIADEPGSAGRALDDGEGPPGTEAPTPATGAELRRRLVLAADGLVRHPYRGWFYGDSVGFEGLLAATDLLADPRYAAFAHGFLRGWASRATVYQEMDNTVPGRALCAIAERTGDRTLLDAAVPLAAWLRGRPAIGDGAWVSFASAPLREPYGGEGLPTDESALLGDAGPGVYVDCLHFDPPFLVHLGRLRADAGLVEAGVDQALAYVSMLQDPDSGLFHHFWLERTGRPYIPGWGRGQGWALLGLLDVLEGLPAGHRARPSLEAATRRLAGAMRALQRPDGSWAAVVQEPGSGPESSTAAFMAVAFRRGADLGLLDPEAFLPPARRAWAATRRLVGPDGVLAGVSAAVWSSTSLDHYVHVPRGFTVPWGQGPLLMAAADWARDEVSGPGAA